MKLLVVDTQKLITNDELFKFDLVRHNIKTLIDKARKNNIEVIYIRHDDGEGSPLTKNRSGFEIFDEFAPRNTEFIFDKNVSSPFKESGLLRYLKDKDENTLVVVGLQTDFCIDATVKCGFEHNFDIIVPAYSNSTVDNNMMSAQKSYEYYNDFIWPNRYAACISVEDTIALMKKNGAHFQSR